MNKELVPESRGEPAVARHMHRATATADAPVS